ncbi:30S ribosomal protein S3 [bacterium]|nr:30S ribosomal protein S3 [bacterium]
MGQKVHPYGFRVGIFKNWKSRWYAEKDYAPLLHEDLRIRELIKNRLSHAGISDVEIERFTQRMRINIMAARPGIIIGRKGVEVERLKKLLSGMTDRQIHINIREIKNPDADAQLQSESIALQLVRRVSFRRALKRAMQAAKQAGVLGIKVMVAGRLGGAEMSRTEWYREGRVPLHTLRADIDYGFSEARTTYGQIGVKVWIYKGELKSMHREEDTQPKKQQEASS